eukprot:517665_1
MAQVLQRIRKTLVSPNNRLNALLMRYPKCTSIGLTVVKTMAADLIVQTTVDGKSLNNIDFVRASVFGTFGFVYLGCFQYWVYNILFFRWFPSVSIRATINKVSVDQLIKHPFLYWPTFYFVQTSLNERKVNRETMQLVIHKYKNNIWTDMKALWSFAVPLQIINFSIMPLHLRLPFISISSFFWCCFLSVFRGNYQQLEDKGKRNVPLTILILDQDYYG